MGTLKRSAPWVLAAAVTVFMSTDLGVLITMAIVIPIAIIVGLKTPKEK